MFELPDLFKSFNASTTIAISKDLKITFSLPSASQYDWSSLYADKMSEGATSRIRFFRRCLLASCTTHLNGQPLSEICTDPKQKEIAVALATSDFSKLTAESILDFYNLILSQIIGRIPENLTEAAYLKFEAWIRETTFEIMPLPENVESDNDDILDSLKNTDRGNL